VIWGRKKRGFVVVGVFGWGILGIWSKIGDLGFVNHFGVKNGRRLRQP